MMKRMFDVLVSASLLVLLTPLLVMLALAVRILLGAPILFRQQRPGLHGQPFTLFKFRTLRNPSVQEMQEGVASDGKRLTPFGGFLRKCSLDELPSLYNVLVGHMSLVGPRPLLMSYLLRYNAEQARRHEVRPGITGYAQVNGRNALCWERKFDLDVWYVNNQSFTLDLKILALTLVKVFKREGITSSGEATSAEFMGSKSGESSPISKDGKPTNAPCS